MIKRQPPFFYVIAKIWKPLTAVFFWGLSFIATKYALKELTPVLIINFRLLLAIPLLAVIGISGGRKFKLAKKQAGLILMLALISVFHLWIQVTGLQYTSAANTGWIIGTAPVFISILSWILLKESLSAKKIAGIFVSMSGLLLLISKGNLSSISFISGKGDMLVLASCLTWGFYSVVNRKIALDYSPMMSIFYLFVFMAVLTFPFNLNINSFNTMLHLSSKGWMAIGFLGIFCSGIAYVFWAQALSKMKSANVASFLYFEPFVTVLGAWFILGESITGIMVLSGIIIMLGVALVNF